MKWLPKIDVLVDHLPEPIIASDHPKLVENKTEYSYFDVTQANFWTDREGLKTLMKKKL